VLGHIAGNVKGVMRLLKREGYARESEVLLYYSIVFAGARWSQEFGADVKSQHKR
jgi:hypothetical protein